MTAANVWDELTPEPKRDRYGRYLITPAAGGKATAHTRATTIAKTLSDQGSLIGWKQRMTALGLAARPDLMAQVQAADSDDRKTLNRLVDDAAEAGGASARANLGTALHSFVEQINHGRDVTIPAEWQSTIDAYRRSLADHGLEVVAGLVERIVVLPVEPTPIAGTFDLAVMHPSWDRPRIADLKTGSSVNYGVGEWAVQLAIYAHAETMWSPADDTHTPMPDVDPDRAVIFHAPAGDGTCTVYDLDIAAGWPQVQVCLDVRDWRKRGRKLLEPMGASTPPRHAEPPAEGYATAIVDDRVAHLTGRLRALAEHAPDAMSRVAAAWPAGAPTLKAHTAGDATLTVDQLDVIDQLVTGAETTTEAPFGSDTNPAGRLSKSDPRVADLRDRVGALPSDLQAQLAADLEHHGIPKLSSGKATVADLDAVVGLLDGLAEMHTERQRMAWAHLNTLPTVGNVLPSDLTAAAVDRLGDRADAYEAGWLQMDPRLGQLIPADDIVDRLVERFGGKRPALDAARFASQDLGERSPRSTADLIASVPLVARLAVTEASNPNPERPNP